MNALPILRGFSAVACALVATFAAAAPVSTHGGGHAGTVGIHGGGYGGFRGHNGSLGYRSGYGGRFGRWHGGYGYGGWAWPGYGLLLSTLPYDYSGLWWDSVPYYHAADDYLAWDSALGEYHAVNPLTAAPGGETGAPPPETNLYAYPKSGQSTGQQAQDRQQCLAWASSQTGADAANSQAPAASANSNADMARRQDFLRAQSACLQGRGYSVR